MARQIIGRGSERLYNEQLTELFEVLKNINESPENIDEGPITRKEGALWHDRLGTGDLKYKENGEWKTIFEKRFQMICDILNEEEPASPVEGQLWLNDGILMYFSGAEWLPVKSVNVDKDFNLSSFEQFLIISPMQAAGNFVIENTLGTIQEATTLFEEEEFLVVDEIQDSFELKNGRFSMGRNAVKVYANGRRLAKGAFREVTSSKIVLTEPVVMNTQIVIEYINMDKLTMSVTGGKSKTVKQEIITTQSTTTLTLDTDYTPGANALEVYVFGKRLPNSAYQEIDTKTIRFAKAIPSGTHIEIVNHILSYSETEPEAEEGLPSGINTLYTQFLLPDVSLDKVFINGFHNDKYDKVTNVAIQYPNKELQGKVVSGIHVNPNNLIDIKKSVFKVDKVNPIIPVSETNTEFYGLRGGVGKLLIKSNDSSTDYTTVTQGIRLSPEAAKAFDFVYAITYVFKKVKNSGLMIKKKITLSEDSAVYVGNIDDPLCVFTQGLYLSEDPQNYTYDKESGYLSISLESKMDIGIISFPKKESGIISELNEEGLGIVDINKEFNKRLVFVYGESMNYSIADYSVDPVNPKRIYINNAYPGMHYAIVETEGEREEDKLHFDEGLTQLDPVSNDVFIPIFDENGLNETDQIIVFVNGLLVMRNDVVINSADKRIEITGGLKEGLDYIILKDNGGRFIFSDYVSFSTIPLGDKVNSAIAYVENHFISDAKAVYTTHLPAKGRQGEIKCMIVGGENEWYIRNGLEWEHIDKANALYQMLENEVLHHTSDDYVLNILKNFGKKECTIYAYKFANAVEYPLLRGNIVTLEGKDTYRTAFNHKYTSGKNELSIWQNGVRQYPDTTGNEDTIDGYFELGNGEFKVPESFDGGIFYVVEPTESSEQHACERQILTHEDRINGSINSYQTNISLYPGNVRVFISGLRQPSNAYKIIDSHTIMLYNEIIGSADNFPTETIIDEDGNTIHLERNYEDKILIEVRQDYKLKEITIPVRYAGQKEFDMREFNEKNPEEGGDELPESLIYSSDFIMIYINGLAYGKDYLIDKDAEKIILLNEEFTSRLGVDPIDKYFKANPQAYLKWRLENDGIEYQPKPIKDKITFEWR